MVSSQPRGIFHVDVDVDEINDGDDIPETSNKESEE